MPCHKRASILAMIARHAAPLTIIEYATTPPGDNAYLRRLRLWVADCAARALPLLAQHQQDHSEAIAAITAARFYANGFIRLASLAGYDDELYARLYQDAKHTGYSVASEVSLAAALSARANIWLGAAAAAQHARSAILNAIWGEANFNPRDAARESHDESQWQVMRLGSWLADIEPVEWPITSEAA